MQKILKVTILLGLMGGLIFVSFSPAFAVQTIAIRELKFDKPMPVKSGDTVRFIVRLENPSSIDSANFSVVLAVLPKPSVTAEAIFSLREPYSHLRARTTRSIRLVRPFTIPMDYKDLYIWIGILDFPGEDWPHDQGTDMKSYQLPGERLAVTGAHTSYKYRRILPYPMRINADILKKIPMVPVK